MIQLPLSRGLVAIIDDADAYLAQFKWSAMKTPRGCEYAVRTTSVAGKRKTSYLHREIMNASDDAEVDHINHDGLDCRRTNLRVVTRQQNAMNIRKQRRNTSGFKGVGWHPRGKRWYARIRHNKEQFSLGLFSTPEDAARAYDAAAKELCGDFANLNFSTEKAN